MTHGEAPFEFFYRLGELSRAGDEVNIELGDAERRRLAQWAELDAVDKFAAVVSLTRLSANRFGFEARLEADIVQPCVVTLEPVRSHIERTIKRDLHLAQQSPRLAIHTEALTPAAADDEVPEEIESLEFDLAGPLLEEFSLAIDPYPRAPGVNFAQPGEQEPPPESPFAQLKALKERR